MKKVSFKYLSLLTLLVSSVVVASCNDCPSSCDVPCGPCPLDPCAVSWEFHAGIVPTVWVDRECFLGVRCGQELGDCDSCVERLCKLPKFRSLFKTPWTVGGRISRAYDECHSCYVEFNYIQARDRGFCCNVPLNVGGCEKAHLEMNTSKYKAYNGFAGVRHYMGRYWCDRVAFFVGMKVGFQHHREIRLNLAERDGECPCDSLCGDSDAFCNTNCSNDCNTNCGVLNCLTLFENNTVIAAGGEVGMDYCINGNFSFVIDVNFIGTGALKANENIVLRDRLDRTGLTNLLLGSFSTQVNFPIQFGLRYTF